MVPPVVLADAIRAVDAGETTPSRTSFDTSKLGGIERSTITANVAMALVCGGSGPT